MEYTTLQRANQGSERRKAVVIVSKCVFVHSLTFVAGHWSRLHQMFSCHFYETYCTRFGRERVNIKICRINKCNHLADSHIAGVHHYLRVTPKNMWSIDCKKSTTGIGSLHRVRMFHSSSVKSYMLEHNRPSFCTASKAK